MAEEAKSKGNAAFAAGNFSDAVRHFTEAIALSPSNHVLYSNRSAAYASLNRFCNALSDAQKTVELNPSWAKGYSRLSAAHLGLNNVEDAIATYEKGLEIDPNNEALKSGLADARSKLERDDEDISFLASRAAVCLEMGKNHKTSVSKNMAVVEYSNVQTALANSYDRHIRPLLDAIDRLRHLKVMQEGIQLPTIVVVGDQSSGKSSVLESLAGISLPRGQGICTRVPLIMRLQDHPSLSTPELQLEYQDKIIATSESNITQAINDATQEIAGTGKGICSTPLTLVVKKKGVPDLTMVDLPGITRVPVHGQPENIYEQISSIIMEYISHQESIVLNVLSASVDFPTCESIRMSQQVDRTGERTLAVVTKADKSPEGLLEKVTVDAVNIGLGYVCVRNRVGDESYEQARAEEVRLFKTHPLLSKIDKSIVGIPVLAQKLMQIQAASISKCLPDIVKKINEKLNQNIADLDSMPPTLSSAADATRAFMHMLSSAKETLRNILIKGEYDDSNDKMHGKARLADMLKEYSEELPSKRPTLDKEFLMDEIKVLEESKGIGLPNFLPRSAFLTLLQRKISLISGSPIDLMSKVWGYLEVVVVKILLKYSENYPQLQSSTRRVAQNIIEKLKKRSFQFVKEMIEMEDIADYTSNPSYMNTWHELMEQQETFMQVIQNTSKLPIVKLNGFGEVEVGHLRLYEKALVEEAFDMRMRLTAYWRILVIRLVDNIALHILYSLKILVENELENEMFNEILGSRSPGIERMLEESPSTAGKRERLRKSIELLNESKEVVAKIMDHISSDSD